MCGLQPINMAATVSWTEDEGCTMHIITPSDPEDQTGLFQRIYGFRALSERKPGQTKLLRVTCGSLSGMCRDSGHQRCGFKSCTSAIVASRHPPSSSHFSGLSSSSDELLSHVSVCTVTVWYLYYFVSLNGTICYLLTKIKEESATALHFRCEGHSITFFSPCVNAVFRWK